MNTPSYAFRLFNLRLCVCVVLLFAFGNVVVAQPTLVGTRTGTVSNSGTLGSWSPPQAWSITINWTATTWSDGINRLSFTATGTTGWCSVVVYKRASPGGAVLHSYFNQWAPGDATSTVGPISGANFDIVSGQVWEIEAQGTLDHTASPQTVSLVESVVTWSATGTVEPDKQVTFDIPENQGVNDVIWSIVKVSTGVSVASMTQPPGAPQTTLTAAGLPPDTVPTDYVLKFWLPSLKFDSAGGTWQQVSTTPWNHTGGALPTAETVFDAVPTATPTTANIVPTGTTPSPATNIHVTPPQVGPNVAVKPPGTGGAIWNTGSGGAGLTDTVYKEGVDKIIASQAVGNAHLGTVAGLADDITGAAGQGAAASAGAASQGAAAKTAVEALFPTVPPAPSAPGNGAMPNFAFSIGGVVANINPFTSERFATVASWCRASIAWLTLVLLGWWMWSQMGEWVRGFSTIQQAKGNAVIAGSGAQAMALLAAAAITVAIVTGLTGLIGWATGDISFALITSMLSSSTPAATMESQLPGAYWILNQLFPLSTMFAALIARVTFNMYASSLFAGVMAVIRFIVF